MSELRYVITDEIKKAVAGRETDVLDGLGIDWRAGRPHIQCPYPDHADNDPSWRWDERQAHAICTCTTNGHADGIFDVVTKTQKSWLPKYFTTMISFALSAWAATARSTTQIAY